MNANNFVKIQGIKGACTIEGFEGCIEVDTVNYSAQQPTSVSRGSGGGGTTSQAYHGDVLCTKTTDDSTPIIAKNLWLGKTLPSVAVTMCKMDGAKRIPYLTIDLKDVVVSSFQLSSGGSMAQERLSFNYGTIKLNYHAQSPEGSAEGNIPAQTSLITGKVN